jgi:hypothetical protein
MVVVNFIDEGNRRIYKYHERLAGLGNIKRAIAIFYILSRTFEL